MASMPNQKRFYVYRVLDAAGAVIYIGKGTGKRMFVSLKERGGATVEAIKHFAQESAAFKYEAKLIAKLSPCKNKANGHNGPSKPRAPLKGKFYMNCERLGTRVVAARLWLAFANKNNADMSKVDAIRSVAYG